MQAPPTQIRRGVILAATLGAMLVVSGCGGENADLDNGREKFVANCARCHYLADAGSAGEIGPDLDASFADARSQGFGDATIEGIVSSQIANPRETDADDPTFMPADLVTGEDASDVAAYVASVAGVPGIEPPEAPGGGRGEQVFVENGCGACHSFVAAGSAAVVGPNLDEVLPGQSKGMITQSIVDPEAELSPGFAAGIMPQNYGEVIAPADLEALVDYLSTSAGGEESDTRSAAPGGSGSNDAG